jgi:hypothetical protein
VRCESHRRKNKASGFVVLTAERLRIAVVLGMTPRSFWGTCCLHIQCRRYILEMEAEGSSEASVNVYQATRCHP